VDTPDKIILIVVLSFIALPEKGFSCGVAFWNCCQVRGFFDNVDKQGHVQLTVKLAEITAVSKNVNNIHIFAIFKSDSANISPLVGYGWTVPLFESRFYQTEADIFCMLQPDGLTRYFVRDKKNPNLLHGKRPWSATIRGNVITAQCKCTNQQKSVLVFNQGRLTSMSITEGKFDFCYSKNALTEIKQENRSVLKIVDNTKAEKVPAIEFPDGRRVSLALVDRPQISVAKDKFINAGSLMSLGCVTDGKETRFSAEYGVLEKSKPFIRMSDRIVSWNPINQTITRDGDWIYKVTPADKPWNNAAVRRTNTADQSEYIYHDLVKGVETVETIDGAKTITWKFTSGQMQGQIRKIESYQSGKLRSTEIYSYDEKGRFRRHRCVTFDNGEQSFVEQFFNEEQRPSSLIQGANTYEYVYNGKSFSCEAVICNGKILKCNTTNGLALAQAYLKQQTK